ncbi:hypothetical protein MJO28_017837 [Puccinia striiformis f. sp. tritici]|nr:hypothetical protein MJO28_017837 [Puccinia striiformis f. sp. tritici]
MKVDKDVAPWYDKHYKNLKLFEEHQVKLLFCPLGIMKICEMCTVGYYILESKAASPPQPVIYWSTVSNAEDVTFR